MNNKIIKDELTNYLLSAQYARINARLSAQTMKPFSITAFIQKVINEDMSGVVAKDYEIAAQTIMFKKPFASIQVARRIASDIIEIKGI